jgi:hypothetical protein
VDNAYSRDDALSLTRRVSGVYEIVEAPRDPRRHRDRVHADPACGELRRGFAPIELVPPLQHGDHTMKPVKLVVVAAAAIAVLSTFALAYLKAEGFSMTLWELRKLDVIHGYIILGAMVLPLVFGGLAIKSGRFGRGGAIASLLAFGISLVISIAVFSKAHASFGKDGGLGAKLMLVAFIAGAAASLVGTVKPERA